MQVVREIVVLLKKELLLEWRMKYAISGILLYVLSAVFIIFAAFAEVEATTWNALFWSIILFASINAIVKSFVQENGSNTRLTGADFGSEDDTTPLDVIAILGHNLSIMSWQKLI